MPGDMNTRQAPPASASTFFHIYLPFRSHPRCESNTAARVRNPSGRSATGGFTYSGDPARNRGISCTGGLSCTPGTACVPYSCSPRILFFSCRDQFLISCSAGETTAVAPVAPHALALAHNAEIHAKPLVVNHVFREENGSHVTILIVGDICVPGLGFEPRQDIQLIYSQLSLTT